MEYTINETIVMTGTVEAKDENSAREIWTRTHPLPDNMWSTDMRITLGSITAGGR